MYFVLKKTTPHVVLSSSYVVSLHNTMVGNAFMLRREKQTTYIKIKLRLGKTAQEILKALQEVSSEGVLVYKCSYHKDLRLREGGPLITTGT